MSTQREVVPRDGNFVGTRRDATGYGDGDVERGSERPSGDDDPGVLERLLRDDGSLDAWILDDGRDAAAIRALLAVAVGGLASYGLAVGIIGQYTDVPPPIGLDPAWYATGLPVLVVPVSLVGSFLTATAVGLPSFYFYTRLGGVDVSFGLVTAQSLRALAKTAVVLWAMLPVYVAWVLLCKLGAGTSQSVVWLGLALPFLAGLFGLTSVYSSFRRTLGGHLEPEEGLRIIDPERRSGVLWIVLAWGALFTSVAPVALWRLGNSLTQLFV